MDLNTIKTLYDNDVELIARIHTPTGCESVHLTPEEIVEFVTNREKFSADYFEVTEEQYEDWKAAQGKARCSATTKKGTPCKIPALDFCITIQHWLEEDGGLCTTHQLTQSRKETFEKYGLKPSRTSR